MRITFISALIISAMFTGCGSKPNNNVNQPQRPETEPLVKEDGKYVEFPANSKKTEIFKSQIADFKKLTMSFSAPA